MRLFFATLTILAMAAGCTTRQARHLNEYLRDGQMDVRPTGNEAVLRELREIKAEQQSLKTDVTDLRSLGNAQAAGDHGREVSDPQPAVSESHQKARVVYFYTLGDDCAPCVRAWNDLESLMRLDSQLRVEKRPTPRWVPKDSVFPVLHYKTSDGSWRTYSGWSTLKAFVDDYEAHALGKKTSMSEDDAQPPSSQYEPPLPQRAPLYSVSYPNNWSWPGDLRVHLQASPHKLSRRRVYLMSDGECVRVHDSYHDRYGARQAAKTDRMLAKAQVRSDRRQERREQGGVFVRVWRGLFGAPQDAQQSYQYQYQSQPVYQYQQTYRVYYNTSKRSGRCPTC